MEAKDFSALRISLASPEQIRSWSYGEVTKPETINYRRLRPEMDGLFCERIFGPTRDWQCYCGKYKNIRYRGIICDKCGVEVTRSSVRRERMGHIELAAPVAHVWYTRRVPSYLGLLLDVSRRNLDRVLYFAQYVVTTVDEDARGKAIARIEKELQSKEAELSGAIEDQMTALRDNRDQIAVEFETKAKAIRDYFDAELARLSDEVMTEAQSAQTSVENLLGQDATEVIKLDSASAVVVAKGETIANDHISKIQTLVNEHLSSIQGEIEALAQEEIGKVSGEIDTANVDVDSTMDEQLQELDDKLRNLRESADKQIGELNQLQSLVAYSETATKIRNAEKKDSPFISESKYRELKSKFGNVFQAAMGAEAFYEILSNINMTRMAEMLWDEVRTARSKQVRRKATKRLRVVESLRSSRATVMDKDETKQENEPHGNRPEWMILTVLPVIPPDLRPMVQLDGGRFATSDLNDLYRRVINRNNRLKHLLDLGAPDVIVRNEKRMLQEAVDSLIDNSQRGKALSRRGRRELKSLSDMLKGKKGRFRRNLLGKRVDYSGRSVIVIGPKLKLHQCGLPKTMALELYRPFVISRLVAYNYASNVKGAKRIIERERPEVWEVLEEVIKERPVLLNRAPTLHRLGIQAFEPLLVEGKAIQIHPLVCSAFNADFDGDQMAVHVPLSEQAVKEARDLMLSTRNLLKPSDGAPIVGPSKDMVLGNYYLTMDPTVEIVALRSRADEFRTESALYDGEHKVGIAFRSNGYYYAQFRHVPNSELYLDETAPDANGRPQVVKSAVDRTVAALLSGEVDCMLANAYEMRKYLRANDLEDRLEITNLHERRVVVDMDEVEYLYGIGLVNLHSPILLGNVYDELSPQDEPEICTVGRALFNRILPDEMRFVQETLGKRGLQDLVARCYQVIGGERTTEVVDAIKNFGFHYATISGTTIAVSDLTIPAERADILREAEDVVTRAERDFRRGLMTEEERYQITIDEWNRAKDYLQDQIQDALDPYGPIAIMALSGSTKGGFGPITQLAGMRGLMADPSGRIIDLPIRSHFREGLNALEYFISTHGARKGLADTALRTADAGYLTRRLVDVAQDMIVNRWDCGTNRGLLIRRSDDIAGQSIGERIVGRCSAQDLYHPKTGELLMSKNTLIDEKVVTTVDEDLPVWIPKFSVTNRWAQDVYHPESREKLAAKGGVIGEDRDETVQGIADQVLSALSKVLRLQNGHFVERDVYDPKTGKRLAEAGKRIKNRSGVEFVKRFESARKDALNFRVEYYARRHVYDPKTGDELAKADTILHDGANFTERVKSALEQVLKSEEGHYAQHDVYDPHSGDQLVKKGDLIVSQLQPLEQYRPELYEKHFATQDAFDPNSGTLLAKQDDLLDAPLKSLEHFVLDVRIGRYAMHDAYDPDTGKPLVKNEDLVIKSVDEPLPPRLSSLMRFELKGDSEHQTESDLFNPRTAKKLESLEGNWKYVYRTVSNDFEEGFHSSNPEVVVYDPSVEIVEEYLRDIDEVEVRSPLTCDLVHGVCAMCYGRDLGTGEMVNIGSAVGIIAAQSIGEPGTQLTLRTFHSGGTAEVRDITSGLPRVEELFEARRAPKGEAVTTGIAGKLRLTERSDGARIATVIFEDLDSEEHDIPEGWDVVAKDGKDIKKGAVIARNGDDEIVAGLAGKVHVEESKVYIRFQDNIEEELEIPANARLRKEIYDGMDIEAGEQLTEGSKNPHRILRVLGANATQLYLLSEIQEVYRSQGVNIADKHFETVIRKMMCKVQITKSGDSDLLPGELIDQLKLLEINERLINEDAEPCSGTPVLLGITKAALSTESYLSAASFQHTIKVLAGAAIEGQVDPLHGLKENVIIGKLIPAGTGFHAYHEREVIAPPVTLEAQGALDRDEVGDIDDFENMLSEL